MPRARVIPTAGAFVGNLVETFDQSDFAGIELGKQRAQGDAHYATAHQQYIYSL